MNLIDRVREQLLAIGIDDSGPAPPEEVLPETNDISWQSQRDYLADRLDEKEGMALFNLLHHPDINADIRHALDNPMLSKAASDAKHKMSASEAFLDSVVALEWPTRR